MSTTEKTSAPAGIQHGATKLWQARETYKSRSAFRQARQGIAFAAVKAASPIERIFEQDGHRLRRSGSRLVCRCPFHSPDRTPSCVLFTDQGLFHCFGCGAGGDVIEYVRRRDGIGIREAVEKLVPGTISETIRVQPQSRPRMVARAPTRHSPDAISAVLTAEWEKMNSALVGHERRLVALAEFRGTPAPTFPNTRG